MARGGINEFQDPQTRRLIDSLIQQAGKANNGSITGGLASVLNQGMAGYRMGQDKRQRGAANTAIAEAMGKQYSAPVKGRAAELVGSIDNESIMADPDEYPELAEKLKDLSGTGTVSNEDQMIDKAILQEGMAGVEPSAELAQQIDPSQAGGRTQLDSEFIAQDEVASQPGYDPHKRALSNLLALGGDNPYASRMAAQMGMQQAGADRASRADAEKRRLDFADKLRFLQEKKKLGVSATGRPASGIQYYDKLEELIKLYGSNSSEVRKMEGIIKTLKPRDLGGTVDTFNPLRPNERTPNIQKTLKPGERPETKAAQSQATGAGSGIGQENQKQYFAVQNAFSQIEKISELTNHLRTSDAITGAGADMLKNLERVKAFMGNKVAAGKASDTEILDVMMGSEVFPMIKALGVGARGMDTPAEREFMRSVLTGSIQMNKTTLIRMAEIRANVAKRSIERWNKRVGSGDLDNFFKNQGLEKKTYKIKEPAAPRDGTVTSENPLGF
tara:strand:+ start:14 stop:1516 length:1503 start_codon:yes stop_codon:yes gene_type:complete